MAGRVGISSRGLDFAGGVDLSGKWLVLLEVVRMEESRLEKRGCQGRKECPDKKGIHTGDHRRARGYLSGPFRGDLQALALAADTR